MADQEDLPEDSPGFERTSTLRKRKEMINSKKLNSTMRKIQKTLEQGNPENMTEWESEFLTDVNERVSKDGSAFYDANKGDLESPLSILQGYKLREIGKEMKMRERMGMKAARRLVFQGKKKGAK